MGVMEKILSDKDLLVTIRSLSVSSVSRPRSSSSCGMVIWTPRSARRFHGVCVYALMMLRDAGWTVLRFWEHEDAGTVAATIQQALLNGRDSA
ncbi:very short patch repair endonuclease [Gordonia sputi]|uniref:very short patch repair endonuclease n=1 Tax=Gordonia TaxID=2053 RepID=UPI0020438AC2|nr:MULTISPECIES: very short patch repair endonuclease [Gordonia]MCM3897084.1 very short patch repair endonuclease [Gordonia sputi]